MAWPATIWPASLHGLDTVRLDGIWVTVPRTASGRRARVSRRDLRSEALVIGGVKCTDGLRTLVDLAPWLSDLQWEQALESALRKRLTSIGALEALRLERVRRVLGLRPAGAPPTESLLETLMLQLARTVPGLGEPVRQLWIEEAHARLDQAWPDLGFFLELDGHYHLDQPVYDARRETAVVAATGWLCGRFTWTEVVRMPHTTARRLAALAEQARRRPLAQPRSSSAVLAQPRSSSATR